MASDLTWRPLSHDDLDDLFGLITRIQDHDKENERTIRADLDTMAERPWLDLSKDSLMAIDPDGVPRAWGRTGFQPGATEMISVHLVGGVDPDWRGRGLGRRILKWQAERALVNVENLRDGSDQPAQIGGCSRSTSPPIDGCSRPLALGPGGCSANCVWRSPRLSLHFRRCHHR